MRIGVITYSGKELGIGHLTRSSSIHNELLKIKSQVVLLHEGEITKHQNNNLPKIIKFNVSSPSRIDLEFLIKKFDILLFDILLKDLTAFKALQDKVFSAAIMSYPFDIKDCWTNVIFYPSLDNIIDKKICSGPDYICFNQSFSHIQRHYRHDGKIVVSMGGTDAFGFTLPILKALLLLELDCEISILCSQLSSDFKEITEIAGNYDNISVLDWVDDMAHFLQSSSLIILNGGLTRYEATVLGIPFVAVSVHQTQYDITNILTSKTGAINWGVFNSSSIPSISKSIITIIKNKTKRQAIHENSIDLLDTLGPQRIANELLNRFDNEKTAQKA